MMNIGDGIGKAMEVLIWVSIIGIACMLLVIGYCARDVSEFLKENKITVEKNKNTEEV